MKIVPYRVLFKTPEDNKEGKYTFGIVDQIDKEHPITLRFCDTDEEVMKYDRMEELSGNEYFHIETHDRNGREFGAFWQIAFRIVDASPYTKEELSLHLDSHVFQADKIAKENDLWYDETNDLWYQRSVYREVEGEWRVVTGAELNRKVADHHLPVDSITTSGVFGIVVKRNGQLLRDIKVPMVYVLPSTVTRQDYITMLNDLIRIHESLVMKPDSQVGMDKSITYEQWETQNIQQDADLLSDLLTAVNRITRTPLNVLTKRYTTMPVHKVKRYDHRVLQEYARTGGSGKVRGIEYYEDHDIYENRVIKYVLENLYRRIDAKLDRTRKESDAYEQILQPHRSFDERVKRETLCLTSQPAKRDYYEEKIEVDFYRVKTVSHYPFRDNLLSYIGLDINCNSKREHIWAIQMLAKVYKELASELTYNIEADLCSDGKNEYRFYNLSQIISFDGAQPPIGDYSDNEYVKQLNALFDQYPKLLIKGEQIRKWEAKHAEQERKNAAISAHNNLFDICKKLRQVLDDKWFSAIRHISTLPNVRKTQLFSLNPAYRAVYPLLLKALNLHPMLSVSFDANRFGVYSTEQVYEYWVFYAILRQLQTMGFRFADPEAQTIRKNLTDDMNFFVSHSAYPDRERSIRLEGGPQDSHFELELIHEKEYPRHEGDKYPLCPDYSIYITTLDQSTHWYFMDAKYRPLDAVTGSPNSYVTFIQKVAIQQYMEKLRKSAPYKDQKPQICGSYIIAASIADRTSADLAANGRLYGGNWYIEKKTKTNGEEYAVEIEMDSNTDESCRPKHKYGAIMLTPSNVKELKTLFRMIFEYLETAQDTPSDEDQNDQVYNDHKLLHYCWDCGTPIPCGSECRTAIPLSSDWKLKRNRYKYYTTCPQCKAFRVDNYCRTCRKLIVKHTEGNFHLSADTSKVEWNYICPQCGKGASQ